MSERQLEVRIVGQNDLGPAFQQADQAIAAFSRNAAQGAQTLGTEYDKAVERATKAIDRFHTRLDATGKAGAGAIAPLIVQQERLRQQIEATFGSLDKATPAVVADYRRISAEVTKAKDITRELTDAVQDQAGELKEAGVQWRGIGDAMGVAAGKYGTVLAQAGAVTAALTAGWQIGKKLGEATGMDSSGLTSFFDDLKRAGREYHNLLGDIELRLARIAVGNFSKDPSGNLLEPIAAGSSQRGARSGAYTSDPGAALGSLFSANQNKLAEGMGDRLLRLDLEAAKLNKNADAVHRLNLEEIDRQKIQLKNQGYDQAAIAVLTDRARAVENLRYATEKLKNAEEKLPTSSIGFLSAKGMAPGDGTSYGLPTRGLGFGFDALSPMSGQAAAARATADAYAKAFTERMKSRDTVSALGDVFADAALTGGRNFGEIASRVFQKNLLEGADSLLGRLFGDPSKWAKGDPSKGQSAEYFYDASGNMIGPDQMASYQKRATAGNAVLAGGALAINSYSAGNAGEGARTGSLLGGAMAGAGLGATYGAAAFNVGGAVVGAVIGAVVGAVSSYVGEKERQDDYKYARPYISAGGTALLSGPKNLNDQEASAMLARVQQTYDEFKDGYVRLLLKIPNAIIPELKAIDGKFQDNPSGKFMKHFDEWLAGTLPDQIASQFRDGLSKSFESLGMSAGKFSEIWTHLDSLDPRKALELMNALAEGLTNLQTAGDLFHAADPMGFFGGSHAFERETLRLGSADRQSYGQRVSSNDDEILRFAAGIENLSLEGQIAALGELGRMQMDRYNFEKEAIKEIYDLLKSAQAQYEDDIDSLNVQRLTNADGSADQYKIAEYYKGVADRELSRLNNAQSAAEAREAYDAYRRAVFNAEQAGLSQASPQDREAWIKWAQDALGSGLGVLEGRVAKFGDSINDANDRFNAEIDPLITSLTEAFGAAGDGLGGVGRETGELVPRIRDANVAVGVFGESVSGVVPLIDALATSVANAVARIDAAVPRDASSGFVSRTASSRVA